jgi:hypothetical protein
MRPNVTPSTAKRDTKNNQPFKFDNFERGTIQDAPASEINNALADSLNLTIYPRFYEGRTGCRKFTNTRFPTLAGRTGYSAHKVGDRIVSDQGNIFTQDDVGHFFFWGTEYEYIQGYVAPDTVITDNSEYHATVAGAVVAEPTIFWHKGRRLWVLEIGGDYYFSAWSMPSWTKVLLISRDVPFDRFGDYTEYNDYSLVFNGNGLFKIELGASAKVAYKTNIPAPDVRILSVPNFAGAVCRYRYLYSAALFETQGHGVDRQTPTRIMLETGTCTPDENSIDYAEVFRTAEIDALPNTVRTLWVPLVKNTDPQEYQWHLSHFPVWRTLDLEAKNVSDVLRDKYNDPQRFIWVADVPICKAFYARRVQGVIEAARGEFSVQDLHSIIEFEDGQRFELTTYIDSLHMGYDDEYYYGGENTGYEAAAIGYGRVMRGTAAAGVLTRTHGGTFTSADLRKPITDSNGHRHYITEVLDANRVRVHQSIYAHIQGFTIDPTHRNFCDTVGDEILRARMDFYSCYARYREGMPNCNLGRTISGFVVAASVGQKEVYFSHLQEKLDYLIGQYIPIQQMEAQDQVQFFIVCSDNLAVVCATSTWGVKTGLSEFITLPESGEAIAMLPGLGIIDRHIGSMDPGSVQEVEGGAYELVTNEPGGEALRQFNGTQYSQDNFLVDSSLGGRVARAFEKTLKLSASIYDGFLGYINWRRNK